MHFKVIKSFFKKELLTFFRILRFDDENAALTTITTIRVESEINSVKWNPSFPNLVATACDNGNITIINIHE